MLCRRVQRRCLLFCLFGPKKGHHGKTDEMMRNGYYSCCVDGLFVLLFSEIPSSDRSMNSRNDGTWINRRPLTAYLLVFTRRDLTSPCCMSR